MVFLEPILITPETHNHFVKFLSEYQRFYLLYPNSLYLKKSEKYLKKSREILAQHEFMVGNWYFKNKLYASSIARYTYLLKTTLHLKKKESIVTTSGSL